MMGLLLAALCLQRLRTRDEPFQRDIMTYAVIGHELVMGNDLYSDVLDHKPPAVYATFGLAELLVGYGPAEVYLVNVLFSGLALAALSLAGAHLAGPAGGLVAGLLWLLFSYDLAIHGNQPNTELCLNALSSLALAVLMRGTSVSRSWLAGLLLAVASLYKPVVLAIAPLWAAAVLMEGRGRGRPRDALHHVAALGTPSVLVWIATLAYFALDERLGIFLTTVVEFNRDYAGSLIGNLAGLVSPSRLWPADLRKQVPLLVLSLAGVVLGLARGRRVPPLWVAYAAGSLAMVALPGHWWPHYYQVYLPPLVLGSVFGLAQVQQLSAPWGPRARVALLLATVALGLRAHVRDLRLDGDAASRQKHDAIFITVRNTAGRVAALLEPGETVHMHGIDPGIYFHARQRPIAQALWINHLVGPLRAPLRATLRRQLREVRPDVIVQDVRYRLDWLPPGVALWIEQEYVRVPAAPEMGPFQLLVRRDSAARARAFPPAAAAPAGPAVERGPGRGSL